MTLEKITRDFVVSEASKIQYLYTLKHVIRYGQSRTDLDYTESVAEHMWGMHIVAEYFLPLEDPQKLLDTNKIKQLINWHELGEIETGDIPAIHKTDDDRLREQEAIQKVIEIIPAHLQNSVHDLVNEYETQSTAEARFTKAIDKIEPLFHTFNPLGKQVQHELKLPVSISRAVKEPYISNYPFVKKFSDLLHEHMSELGYFWEEAE